MSTKKKSITIILAPLLFVVVQAAAVLPGTALASDDVILDFGSSGTWVLYDGTDWSKLHSGSPESITTGDLDGNGRDEVIVDFGGGSIWVRVNNASWTRLHSGRSELIATGDMDGNGQDEVIIDFGLSGVWVRVNNTSWVKLHPASPELIVTGDMDGNGQDEVIFDFGLSGVWVRFNDSSWIKLHPTSPRFITTGDMDGNALDEVILDFGASGIWVRFNNATWTKLHPEMSEVMTTGDMDGNGQDEVIIDFGGSGIWVRLNNATWTKLHPSRSEELIVTGDMDGNGQDEVLIDFGSSGLWVRGNNATWTKLHPASPHDMATGNIGFGPVIDPTATVTFDLSNFTEISVFSVFRATITQGPDFLVKVTIDEDAVHNLDVTQAGSRLSIGLLLGNNNVETIEAVVTLPVLNSIDLSGVVNVTLIDFNQDQMTVNVGGVSQLRGDSLMISDLTASVSGVNSQLDFGNIRPLGSANIDVGGISRATLNMDVGSTLTGSVTTSLSTLFYYGTNVAVNVTTDSIRSVIKLGETRP